MTEQFNGILWWKQQPNVTNVQEKVWKVDKCVSQIDLRKQRARRAMITDIFFRMYTQCAISDISFISHPYTQICKFISIYWFLSGGYLHNWLIHAHAICSSTYMYMKNVNDVTGWLSQTTDISKYFIWCPWLRDKESRLYVIHPSNSLTDIRQNHWTMVTDPWPCSLTHIYFMGSTFVSNWSTIPSITFLQTVKIFSKTTGPWNID